MPDLINDLAAIRDRQGLAPMPNPHFIQGFGPNDPPPPPYIPPETVVDDPADEFGVDDDPLPASPLIPRPPLEQMRQPVTPAPLPSVALVVLDRLASWKGREVALTEDEEKACRAVVLRAIQRELDADLAAVGRRRQRKSRAKAEPISVEPAKPARVRRSKA